MVIKYWGVRGSIPAPLTTEDIRAKEKALIERILADGFNDKDKIEEYLQELPLSLCLRN